MRSRNHAPARSGTEQSHFLRIKKLTSENIIEVAARHNLREIVSEMGAACSSNIDPTRTDMNIILRGCDTAFKIAATAKFMLDRAEVGRLRHDAVRALEIVVSLPPHAAISIDQARFFDDSLEWVHQYFEGRLLSAVIHRDEGAPHCHILLLPLTNGRMNGSRLMGSIAKLKAMQMDFYCRVAQQHGLPPQPAKTRHSAAVRQAAVDAAYDLLEAHSGLSENVLHALLRPHLTDPTALMASLNLPMPTPKKIKAGFVKTMTRPCKIEKTIGFDGKGPAKAKPIDFLSTG